MKFDFGGKDDELTEEVQKDKVYMGEVCVIKRLVKFSIDKWKVAYGKSVIDLCSDGL